MLVVWCEHLTPKWLVLSLDKVSGLESVQEVPVGDLDELLVTLTPCSFVGGVGKVGVSFLAVLADNLGVIVLIVDEEVLWVLVDVDVDFGKGVVESWFLDSLVVSGFEPLLQHSEFTFLLKLVNKFRNWADSDRVEQLLDVDFIAIELDEST